VLPKTAVELTPDEEIALKVLATWVRHARLANKSLPRVYYAQNGLARLGEGLGGEGALAWLTRVAGGLAVPQNDTEVAKLREALALVIAIVQSRPFRLLPTRPRAR
jgi:hypothetical protein